MDAKSLSKSTAPSVTTGIVVHSLTVLKGRVALNSTGTGGTAPTPPETTHDWVSNDPSMTDGKTLNFNNERKGIETIVDM
jgi:hypothetical protein